MPRSRASSILLTQDRTRGPATRTQVGSFLLAVLLSLSAYPAVPPARAATNSIVDACAVLGVARDDFHLQIKSTLPGYLDLPARLDVRSVRPVYSDDEDEPCRGPVVVL